MSELEDKISGLLNDPEQLQRLSGMARSLMEGGLSSESEKRGGESGGMDPMFQKLLGGFMRGPEQTRGNAAMLSAISPYLDEKRGKKLDRAIKMAKMAEIAKVVFKEYGGDDPGDK